MCDLNVTATPAPVRNQSLCNAWMIVGPFGPEVAGDVLSSQNVKTIDCCVVVNFEVASSSSFRDFPKRSFCDSDVSDCSSGMNAICGRPEVADDISSEDIDTF